MRFETAETCDKFYGKLNDLNKEARREIENGSAHIGHEYRKYQNVITLEPQDEDHLKCAECRDYLRGKILTGIFCIECDNYYHKSCFEMDQDDYEESKNFLADSEVSDLGKTTFDQSHFHFSF